MPKLNFTQQKFLFFTIGAIIGTLSPLSALCIAPLMVILGWDEIIRLDNEELK